MKMDSMHVDFESQYPPGEIRDLDLDELRTYLTSLPCFVLGGDRETPGDPLNIVVLGDGLPVVDPVGTAGEPKTTSHETTA